MGLTNHVTMRLTHVLGETPPAKKPAPKTDRPAPSKSAHPGEPADKK
jgi:hypothetical protein